ncbi:MAG TPA: dTDP-4-dehydrorhamnose reductase, partial [Acidimicrobiales bacterium]|nr:dTDP-4-dehydrorhamnose reductase [Acidimicrobiales bacterium]
MAPARPVVLVTGATGQLGVDLTAALGAAGATAVGAGSAGLDVTNRAVVSEAVAASGAEVVIHAGAWTAVDACEADPDRAFAVNALGTRNVAEAAARAGAHVCYVSTDYVFDGTSPRAYTEWDRPNPTSVYGASKLAGEVEAGPGATVVRISWVFSPRGQNMARTVLRLAGEHPTLRFVDDQTGSPTSTADAAPAIVGLALERRPGVFHLTNQGTTTWFGF